LLLAGVLWRLIGLDYPASFSFDEHHFVENARNYIAHQPDWNDHPPLGKLVLVPAMLLLGDRGLGWRLSSALLGIVLFGLVGVVAARLFRSQRAGLMAAAFAAVDGFFLSYSRTALVDTPLTLFMFAALALMLEGPGLGWFVLAGVAAGLAVATKWTGCCVLLLAPWLLRRKGRSAWHALWVLWVAGAVYLGVFALGLALTRAPISLSGMLRVNWELLRHHAGFTNWDNSAASRWYTWPLLIHPIILHHEDLPGGDVRATSTIGNPVLWYATTAVCALAVVKVLRGLADVVRRRRPLGADEAAAGVVLAGMAAFILPFVASERESYIWHYLGAYGLGLGLLAAALVELEKRRPGLALAFVALVVAVSFYYQPVWTDGLLDRAGLLHRLPFRSWH
jgi:dolichyl-phosphate-mannose--protein O-mannosyl transferase